MFSCMNAMRRVHRITEPEDAYAFEISVDDGRLHGMQILQTACNVK